MRPTFLRLKAARASSGGTPSPFPVHVALTSRVALSQVYIFGVSDTYSIRVSSLGTLGPRSALAG
jgi:hypothetical protein